MATHCPHLGLRDEPGQVLPGPSPEHLCHAPGQPMPVGSGYQAATCLSPAHRDCPAFKKEATVAAQTARDRVSHQRRRLQRTGIPAILPEDERQAERVHPATTPVPMPVSASLTAERSASRRRLTWIEATVLGLGLAIVFAVLFSGYALVYRLQLAGIIGGGAGAVAGPVIVTPEARPTLVPTFTPTLAPTVAAPTSEAAAGTVLPLVETEPTPVPTPTPRPRPPAQAPPSRLVIAKIDLDIPVLAVGLKTVTVGGRQRVLWSDVPDAGGFHYTSAYPGHGGNTVINGHRDIQGAVFRHLDEVEFGDEILVYVGDVAYPYLVTERVIVPETFASKAQRAENLKYIGALPEERLTLVTCTPIGLATHRLLVIARPPEEVVAEMPEAGAEP